MVLLKSLVRSFLIYLPIVFNDIKVFKTVIYILLTSYKDNTSFNILFLESFSIELKTKAYSKGIIL